MPRRWSAAGFFTGEIMNIEQTANRFAPIVLSILRIVLAVVLFQHPLSKFMVPRDLAKWDLADVLALHGMGKSALPVLNAARKPQKS